jgi:FtsP/CotA-like multicopper oxidase with cupredoxin domain
MIHHNGRCGFLPLLVLLVLVGVTPASAKVYFQCPGYNPGIDADADGDGMLRADEGEISSPVSSRQVCIHLSSGDGFANMADVTSPEAEGSRGKLQYIFGFANITGVADDEAMHQGMLAANWPAPTIRLREGDEVYLSLSNVGMMMRPDLFDPHTVHWHGFPNAAAVFDGVPDASISINMGSTLTYYYKVMEPGTFIYHCHVEATEHMQMGMLGNLYVTPAQDGTERTFNGRTYTRFAYNDGDGSTGFDVEYPIQIGAFDPNFHDKHINVQPLPFADMDDKYPMLNGRGYPDTVNTAVLANTFDGQPSQQVHSKITASRGERILLRVSSVSTTTFHTLRVLGIPMTVVGQGSRKLNNYYQTSSLTLGGGQTVDVLLDTADVPAGTYPLYTTNLDHLSNFAEDFGGMMTEIEITAVQ